MTVTRFISQTISGPVAMYTFSIPDGTFSYDVTGMKVMLPSEQTLELLHQLTELEMTIMDDVGADKPSGPDVA